MADSVVDAPPAGRSTIGRAVSGIVNDSLYRNSSLLMLNSILLAGLGFVFWTLAARYFTADAVGTTTTVISAVMYAAMVGTLGIPNSIIRFLAREPDPVRFLGTAGVVAAGAGAFVGLVWAGVPGHFGMPLATVTVGWTTTLVIVTVVALASFGAVAESAIIALRKSKWVVVENGVASVVKLLGIPLAIGFGAVGLFGLFVASLVVSAVASICILVHEFGRPRRRWLHSVDVRATRHVHRFAAGNHIAALASLLPATMVRIIVLTRLGAQEAAFLAMPLMIVALLKVIPSAAAQSLFAEAAADEKSLGPQARRTIRGIYAVLLPAVFTLVVVARPLLSVFGEDYADAGTRCLQLLALSAIPAGANYVADTLLNARRLVGDYVFVNIAGSVCALVFPLAFIDHGLTGIGFGWLLGQIGYFIVAMTTLHYRRRVNSRPPAHGRVST